MLETNEILLRTEQLTRTFGGLAAVNHLDWSVHRGGIHGLIGPNGAGKSTVFNLVSGLIPPTHGAIFFGEKEITGLEPHQIPRIGIARTFQTTRLFNSQTVLANVVTAGNAHLKAGFWSDLLGSPKAWRERRNSLEISRDALKWVGLGKRETTLAGSLPLREQKLLAVAMCLMLRPELVLLDEPTAGLDQTETGQAKELVQRLAAEKGITVVIIEHKMKFVMELCHHIVVLAEGKKLAEGSPEVVCSDERVIAAYLGSTHMGAR